MQGTRHPPIPVPRGPVDELFDNNIKSDGQGSPIQSIRITMFRLKPTNLASTWLNPWKVKYLITATWL